MSQKNRQDIYATVTKQIIELLEQGVKPWQPKWSEGLAKQRMGRPLRVNGEGYRGINILLLWKSTFVQAFDHPTWLTFKQAHQLGGHVKKGEHGTPVVYSNVLNVKEENEIGEEVETKIPFLKSYIVFNISQIEGLPENFYDSKTLIPLEGRIEFAKQFFANTGAKIQHGGNAAFFRPTDDFIQMPAMIAFENAEEYVATFAHEMIHWTGRENRLARGIEGSRFASKGYAMEELVAELGAAFLCADLGLTAVQRNDHAAYIGSWLQLLKQDNRAIFMAASHAQKAVDYLYQLQTNDHKAD